MTTTKLTNAQKKQLLNTVADHAFNTKEAYRSIDIEWHEGPMANPVLRVSYSHDIAIFVDIRTDNGKARSKMVVRSSSQMDASTETLIKSIKFHENIRLELYDCLVDAMEQTVTCQMCGDLVLEGDATKVNKIYVCDSCSNNS